MSIRCKHCEERVPEWDSRDGCCHQCWEQHERRSAWVMDNDHLDAEAAAGWLNGPYHQAAAEQERKGWK